jgi:hypothetical protein
MNPPARLIRVTDRPAALPGATVAAPRGEEQTYTKADLRHERWRAGALAWGGGFMVGAVLSWMAVWAAFTWDGQRTVETFGQGVAMGRAVDE